MLNLNEYNSTHKVCESIADVKLCLEELKNEKFVAIDTETSGLNPYKDYICGFVFGKMPGIGYYIPVRHFTNPMEGAEQTEAISLVKQWIQETPKIEKVFWNAKFDIKMLCRDGIHVSGFVHDAMVLLALVDKPTVSEKLALKSVAVEVLKAETKGLKALQQEKRDKPIDKYGYACLDYKIVGFYACEDGIYTIQIWNYLMELLKK